ncbi:MAG: serine hydrolase domain-containing protein [Solirubrobacteraceae bacterium]
MSESVTPAMPGERICDPPPDPAKPPRAGRLGSRGALAAGWRATGACLAVSAACLVAVFGLLAVAATQAQAQSLSKANEEFVNKTVEEAMKEEDLPGVMISISGPEGEYSHAYGYSNKSAKEAMNLEDHFRAGSITKTFTATAILKEIEAGKLSFSNTLGEYVEGIPHGSEITVRDLLDMRSGLYEYEQDATFKAEFYFNHKLEFGPQNVVEILRSATPEGAPNEKTAYSDSNYVMLGLILEKVTGETAAAAITKDVIEPLGLSHTSFATTDALPSPFSQGYETFLTKGLVRLSTEMNPYVIWTAGAIVSTIGDLGKYAADLGTGALLSSEMQEERLKFCPVAYSYEGPSEYGYGLGILSFGNWLGHDGSLPGYDSEAMYEPKTGAVITGMENLQTSNLTVFSRIFERIGAHLYPGSMETPTYPEC